VHLPCLTISNFDMFENVSPTAALSTISGPVHFGESYKHYGRYNMRQLYVLSMSYNFLNWLGRFRCDESDDMSFLRMVYFVACHVGGECDGAPPANSGVTWMLGSLSRLGS
jgi:hypothetical protein